MPNFCNYATLCLDMQPIILTLGGFSISSFGLFLVLAIILGSFAIWRIVRLYDLDEEKAIDLILLTLASSLIASRLFFVATHFSQFDSILKVVDLVHFPGLPFWGGYFGGIISLFFLSRRFKFTTYQALDLAAVGFFLGLSISSIGCLMGSCEYGLPSKEWFAVVQVGVLERRFPLQIIQAVASFIIFVYLWRSILRFHSMGQIFAFGLFYLGVLKIILEPFRPVQTQFYGVNISYVFALTCIIGGLTLYYNRAKRSVFSDILYSASLLWNGNKRKQFVLKLAKTCYNLLVLIRFKLGRLQKKSFRVFNIKSNPDKF